MKDRIIHPIFRSIVADPSAHGARAVEEAKMRSRIPPKWPQKVLFEKLSGKWEGTCRTWLEPGKLADESRVVGEIRPLVAALFLRHVYTGSMQGRPRHGEETIAFNSITKVVQVSWLDDFGMSTALMFSTGRLTELGFGVRGEYDVGENDPKWGWRTEYELLDDDHLTITAYNITPKGEEAKAVETVYARVGPPTPPKES